MPPTPTPLDLTSMRRTGAFTDLVIECGGETFNVHKFVVCQRSDVLQESSASPVKGAETTVRDTCFDAATMGRMLDFMYEGDYNVDATRAPQTSGHSDGTITTEQPPSKLDTLSHLFCYAIGEHYQVTDLSALALKKFASSLNAIAPDDFADLVAIIAAHTEAEQVHETLQAVAIGRLDELARCKNFLDMLGCNRLVHLSGNDNLTEDAPAELRTAGVLAALGANMLSAASQNNMRVTLEKDKLGEKCEQTSTEVEQLRKQVEKDMTTLRKGEETHQTALMTLQAAERRAKKAEDELEKTRDRAALADKENGKVKQNLERYLKTAEDRYSDLEASTKETIRAEKEKLKRAEERAHKLEQELALSKTLTRTLKNDLGEWEKTRGHVQGLEARNQKLEKEVKDANNFKSEVARLQQSLGQANAELLRQAATKHASSQSLVVSQSSHPWDELAERRQYIIRRICHLANKLYECDGCGSEFNVKLVWDEVNRPYGMDNEVVLKCKHCNQHHRCVDWLG